MKKTKKQKAIEALNDSIKHWMRAKRDGYSNTYRDNGEDCDEKNCALCNAYFKHCCLKYPLYISEGKDCGEDKSVYVKVSEDGMHKRVMLKALRKALKMVEEEW